MNRIALAFLVCVASSASAFALTEADLSQPERQLLAAIAAKNPADVSDFLLAREYVRQAREALNDPAAAAAFGGKPNGFSVRYLLPGDADAINQAVSASVAAMAVKLWT